MYYLIHTAHQTRPFLTHHDFIAQDFRYWGFRVDVHAEGSPYIAEVRRREKWNYKTERRVELMEIWAREVIKRKKQEREAPPRTRATTPSSEEYQADTPLYREQQSQEERRIAKMSSLVQDFIEGIAAFGECGCEIPEYLLTVDADYKYEDKPDKVPTPFPRGPRLLPPNALGLISKYMRLLFAIRHTSNATLPAWANPDILYADRVTLEFKYHEALEREHLVHAVNKAICRDMGRMGRVDWDKTTGVTKVVLFVDVIDCVLLVDREDEEMRDPVPVYERVERPPPYVEA